MITIKKNILRAFLALILLFSASIGVLGFYVIRKNVIAQAQQQVSQDLKVARSVLEEELKKMEFCLGNISVVYSGLDIELIKDKLDLDYLYFKSANETDRAYVEYAGFRIISQADLAKNTSTFSKDLTIEIKKTEKARSENKKNLSEVMVLEYSKPFYDASGKFLGQIFGAKILNKNFKLIDDIRDLVYEAGFYNSKPIGTVTIFQDDVRIATNVIDKNGKRAIGTRVSEIVYNKVIKEGQPWVDRAFVVTNWYLTAYEPIKDINDKIIGILYVGRLEKPFNDMIIQILLVYLLIITLSSALAFLFSLWLSNSISLPITNILATIESFAKGDYESRVDSENKIKELHSLAFSVNEMAKKINSRDQKLNILNRNYLDLISFVTHELKGILSSAVLNTYSIKDGMLGMINFKQKKAIDSIARNLDYLNSTVMHFFDLSRIEKGELQVNKTNVNLKSEVFDPALEYFKKSASFKNIEISSEIDANIELMADLDLIKIVFHNLIANAVKYGNKNGNICISSKEDEDEISLEVYNDGIPIQKEKQEKIFKKFYRLPEDRNSRGTGLGLFITNEIIIKHGGRIKVSARKNGNSFIVVLKKEKK